jgi:dienelactone hydrolase
MLEMRSADEEWLPAFDFIVRAGRAVVVPVFKGTHGRDMPPASAGWYGGAHGSSTFRDATIEWVKDLSATIDYLETRDDVDVGKLGYYGFSFGGLMAPIALAVEPRIRVGVTNVGGLLGVPDLPEADPFNYVPRVHAPFLMINGGYDVVYDYATQQVPMFQRLGTPAADKRHYLSAAGHMVPWDEIIRETLAWLDKYLGIPGRNTK